MAEPKKHRCPECGAPRGADNTPSCACGERAAEALRDARTAEQAAAEDFDPLRIRPYVALDATAPDAPTEAVPPAEPTLPLPAPTSPPAPAITRATESEPRPRTARPRPARRRTALLAASGAVVTVAAAAGFASGLFSYEPPTRDSAAPESVREAVPEARTTRPSPTPTATTPSATTPTPPSPSPTPPPTPTPTQARTTPPASPPPSPTPAQPSPPPVRATGSLAPSDRDEPAPTLRRGDSGPEVTELQLRLRQLYLYNDDPHGHYTQEVENAVRNYQWARGVQTDELGVYGEETRQKLESETSEP
ncbi:peptidoglycan-binding protein [Streptomyces sp. TRM70350]|uniref:peptidoglycan-binding domain-containing protein n=1 Tax=Streptomyces sp. TRM70350 TaxID=2856165 RepID=UPI001C455694|nr:peptidoglycan-binding protein [Streptomyces sp. TRM70350]MBV7698438.1 peptidoglycan-binding protein [Streptomyces sp. TRM70350]